MNLSQARWTHSCSQKRIDDQSITDCATSRFSQVSFSSAGSTQDSSTTASECKISSHHETSAVHSIAHSPSRMAISRLSPLTHASHSRKTPSIQGMLESINVNVRLEPDSKLSMRVQASYHGKGSVRLGDTWKYRHVELARLMIKELTFELYSHLHRTWKTVPSIQRRWIDECRLCTAQHIEDGTYEEQLIHDDHADSISAMVTHIEWGRHFRWSGDGDYDPSVDGNIVVECICSFVDHRPSKPIWQHRLENEKPSNLYELNELKDHINDYSPTVSLGTLHEKAKHASVDPWSIAYFECSRAIIKLVID